MKKVFTVGVFDVFHYGHLRLFQRAKALGDYLIVAVQTSEYILKYKPEAIVVYTTEQRLELVKSIKYVDEVVEYQDVDRIITEIDFDIFAKGEDQTHIGFQKAVEYCKKNNKEVIILERTKNVSSSALKEKIENNFL